MLDLLAQEFSYNSEIPLQLILLRLLGAVILCGLIGIEREIRKDTAGIRTNIMTGVASATFALITLELLQTDVATGDQVTTDPIRLVEAVTAGVAFLAAGVIVFSRGKVRGLTTGAGLWLSAAIGLSVGLGHWVIAVAASILGVCVLFLLRKLEVAAGLKSKKD